MTIALRTQALCKSFGAFAANSNVELTVERGARHALIGPNGAGKSTLINLLTGVLTPSGGDVFLGEERITKLSQHERVKRGLARTFQINTLFPGLTVLESVVLAICGRKGSTRVWWKTAAQQREETVEARELLERLRLHAEADVKVRELAYGKQRLVEIALALAMRPRVLLLDEPAAGIPADASAELFDVIAALPRDVSILLIEHDMNIVFRFAEQVTVLANGSVLAQGAPEMIATHPRVREVYLGETEHD
jgi:branched-chain amino acid transport system ATP-binding protein